MWSPGADRCCTGSGTTVVGACRKVMGDVPIAYIEGVGGVRVGEDEIVTVGKHDVSNTCPFFEGEGADFYWGGRYCHLR